MRAGLMKRRVGSNFQQRTAGYMPAALSPCQVQGISIQYWRV